MRRLHSSAYQWIQYRLVNHAFGNKDVHVLLINTVLSRAKADGKIIFEKLKLVPLSTPYLGLQNHVNTVLYIVL